MEENPNRTSEPAVVTSLDRRTFLTLATAAGVTLVAADKVWAEMKNCLQCHSQIPPGGDFVVDPNTEQLMLQSSKLGIDLVWDRGSPCQNAHKGNGGAAGLCCFRCQMGPCTLGAATNAERGACGATPDIVAVRDLVRRIAGGTAAHVEHARATAKALKSAATGESTAYRITDTAKLQAVYGGLGLSGAVTDKERALGVADRTLEDLGKDEGVPAWLRYKASPERQATWESLGVLPTGAGAELSQALHRTTMGVDADMGHLAVDGIRLGLVDGYCGLHAATSIQDVLFGTPMAMTAKCGLSVLDPAQVNIVVSGHEPILSEKIAEAARTAGVNVVGMCCTGNELLMRKGINPAGSMVQQELAIATGLVDVMVVDVQCVMPNVQRVAEKFHTKVITTNPHAMITGATHVAFEPANADAVAAEIVNMAKENFANRRSSLVTVPATPPRDIMVGFSVEQIVGALKAVNAADPLKPLVDNIASNNIRGIVGIVGCVTPRDAYGYRHVTLTKRLLAENILVVGTGCWAHVAGQYGLLTPDPAYPGVGAGLKAVLQAVSGAIGAPALPACWHMGSCVDNSRIEDVLNAVAAYLKVKISDLPVAASAPEFITEKAVSIGTWAVSLGLYTHIGGQPYISGSPNLVGLLTGGVEGLTGGKFFVEKNPDLAADAIIAAVNEKRRRLGLPV